MFKDKKLTLFSILAGIIGGLVAYKAYPSFLQYYNSYISIGLEILLYFITTSFLILGYCLLTGYKMDYKSILLLILSYLVVGMISIGLEYIYEYNFFKSQDYYEPSSYIFVIDTSGSMSKSDPAGECFHAIEGIINTKDDTFPYAIYSFSNQLHEIRPMSPKSVDYPIQYDNNGGTNIQSALTKLFDLYEHNQIGILGDHPKILFLSDGFASDIHFSFLFNRLLKKYANHNLTISTVGVGNSDDKLLNKIASNTNGIFVKVNDLSNIEAKMKEAIINQNLDPYARTLFSYRKVPLFDSLYAMMRILFLWIIGMMISTANHLFVTGRPKDYRFKINLLKCLIAAMLVEIGINMIYLDEIYLYYIYCILVAMIFVNMIQRIIYKTKKQERHISKEDKKPKKKTRNQSVTSSNATSMWGYMNQGSNYQQFMKKK